MVFRGHVLYVVETTSSSGDGRKSNRDQKDVVERRFSDFEKLLEALE